MRYFPLLAVAVLGLWARPVNAARINVAPGDGTLQAAIDAAAPGDTLVCDGTYNGPVVVDKRLNLVAPKGGAIRIDAGCLAPVGLTIAADKVKIKGGPTVVTGATTTAVVIHDTDRVALATLSSWNTCGTAGTAIEITNSTRLKTRGGDLKDFTTTVIRVADLPALARTKITGFHGTTATTGVAIENVAPGATRKGAKVVVNVLMDQGVTNGVTLTAADGVEIDHSALDSTPNSITIDADSDNTLVRYTAFATVTDAGTSTCLKKNNGHPDQCP